MGVLMPILVPVPDGDAPVDRETVWEDVMDDADVLEAVADTDVDAADEMVTVALTERVGVP